MAVQKPKILFLCAGRPDYPSNAISIRMLKRNFLTNVLISRGRNFYTRTIQVLFRLPLYVYQCDMFYVGWMGQQLIPFIRLFSRKPIIFDTAPSIYDTFLDRGFMREGSIKAKLLYWLDQYAYRQSQIIIVGEYGTRDYFSKLFGIPQEKFRVFPICANNEIFYPRLPEKRLSKKENGFVVEFVGEMAPQHGVEYIMRAAKLLGGSGILFRIAGTGQSVSVARREYEEGHPSHVVFIPQRIPLEQLIQWKCEADLCLGMFGETPKARRSLSNKLFEALAMGKAFLTAGPPEAFGVGLHFTEGQGCFFSPLADPNGLAEKILWIRNHPEERERTAREGLRIYHTMCGDNSIEERIVDIVNEVFANA